MTSPNSSPGSLTHVVIAAGGTAGHVFPALALYRGLKDRGVEVTLLTDERGLVYTSNFEPQDVRTSPSGGLVSGSVSKRAKNLVKLIAGYRKSHAILKEITPDAVVGMGGYAAVGPMLAAQRLKIRNLLHEQNSVMGQANRFTARRAEIVALSFASTEGAKGNAVLTGNPSRAEVVAVGDAAFPTPGPGHKLGVLVMGGSQGARSISETVPQALVSLPAELRDRLVVTHQAREENTDSVTRAYADGGVNAEVETFVDVPAALARCHLVIARSGASTVCDAAVARRPAIYLPLLTHSDLQQVKNAQAVVDQGGALIHREDQQSPQDLSAMVANLLGTPGALRAMADKAYGWSTPHAVDTLIALIDQPGLP